MKKAGESNYIYSKATYQPASRQTMVWSIEIHPSQGQGHPQHQRVPLYVRVGTRTYVYLQRPTEMHRNTQKLTQRQFNSLCRNAHWIYCQGLRHCGLVIRSFPKSKVTSAKSPSETKAWTCLLECPTCCRPGFTSVSRLLGASGS